MSMNHQALKGNSRQRRARKHWLLSEAAGFGGNGSNVPCAFHPDELLTFATVTADRILPGSLGGTYERKNLRPACLSGNSSRQDNLDWEPISQFITNA
jgi:hypothetical protein